MTVEIRVLQLDEVVQLVEWAASEGWNPGLDDAAAFQAADPDGFIGGFVDGEMVAGISAVCYGASFGFIGLYICRPDMRGKGYGKQVWDAGMRRLEGRTAGLDGVPEQQANYASMGFRSAYETHRWSGPIRTGAFQQASTDTVVEIGSSLLSAITAFDARYFPEQRAAFLRHWVGLPRLGRAVIRSGKVAGYGVARRCLHGFKIGPLFADDQDAAVSLLKAFGDICAGEAVQIDVPETSAAFSQALSDAGMQRGFVTARMYRGPEPEILEDGIFAVTTLELG